MNQSIMTEVIDNRKRSIGCYDASGRAKYGQVSQYAKTYGKSRKTLWKYKRRFQASGGESISLLPQKRGPKEGSTRIPKRIERLIVQLHRRLKWKAVRIWAELRDRGMVNPKTNKPFSKNTIYAVLQRYPSFEKKAAKEEVQRYEKLLPGDMGHVDLKKAKNVAGEDPKQKKYYSQLLDDCTRIVYVELLPNKKASTVAAFLERATKWFEKEYGITFLSILSDNGKEYTYHTLSGRKHHPFEQMLQKLSIKHKYTRVCRPQTNGKAERFWRSLNEEYASAYQFSSWKEFNILLKDWLTLYNQSRKHGGIDYRSPVQKLVSLAPLSFLRNHVRSLFQKNVTEIV